VSAASRPIAAVLVRALHAAAAVPSHPRRPADSTPSREQIREHAVRESVPSAVDPPIGGADRAGAAMTH
jgi:hypothetical protein